MRLGALFQLDWGPLAGGFFTGPVSGAFLIACLRQGHEEFWAVRPNLEAGVVLDVVVDDPFDGDFFEVVYWRSA